MDIKKPGVEVYDQSIVNYPTVGLSLNTDAPGAVLTVRRDKSAYNTDNGKGLLVVHFHNKVGSKANVVTLKSK
jgi:hypothetical protein